VVDAPDLERIGQRGLVGAGGDGVVGQAAVPAGQPVATSPTLPARSAALMVLTPLATIGRSWPAM
jgi:hypothetical protein